jgi:hypothetical protein
MKAMKTQTIRTTAAAVVAASFITFFSAHAMAAGEATDVKVEEKPKPAPVLALGKGDAGTRTLITSHRPRLLTLVETYADGVNTKRLRYTEPLAWKDKFTLDIIEGPKGTDYTLYYGVPAGNGYLTAGVGTGEFRSIDLFQILSDGRIAFRVEHSPTRDAVMAAIDHRVQDNWNFSLKFADVNGPGKAVQTITIGTDYAFSGKLQGGLYANTDGLKGIYLADKIAKDTVMEFHVKTLDGNTTYTFAVDFALK